MLIDPNSRLHRARLSSSMKYWYEEHEKYRQERRDTILHHAGSSRWAASLGVEVGHDKRMMANLIQLSAQAHAITLAYGDPQFKAVANFPEAEPIAMPLEAFLNRWSNLIELGETARAVALDSFFGYGVFKVAEGLLPASVQTITGRQAGPMVRRVSQDNFLYDGNACQWKDMTWMADLITVPLDEAKKFDAFLTYNPERTAELQEYTGRTLNNDGKVNHSGSHHQNAVAMTRLINVWLPHSGVIVTWPCNDTRFSGVEGEPLLVRKWNGHHTGPYAVLSHLDIPDNLIPVAESESTKRLHDLFNEMADITAHQATSAKQHPVFEIGSERDMQRLEDADDREPVGVSDITKIGNWGIPGPDQSQTAMMSAYLQMFKEFSGNLDDTLGLGPSAATATQSQLIRQATTARGADKRRRMDTAMVLVAKKLAHLVLNDQELALPIVGTVGNTDLPLDLSWLPPSQMPRNPDVEDYNLTLIPYTLQKRDPAERLQHLEQASQQILLFFQAIQQGLPLDPKEYIEMQANYRDLPELRKLWSGLLPEYNARKESAMDLAGRRPGVGEYIRRNVSERTNGGALTENLTTGVGASAPTNNGTAQV